jgi:hypothetical protein
MENEHGTGPLGLQSPASGFANPAQRVPGPGSFQGSRPLGHDQSAEPMAGKFVSKVICDWVPIPNPDTTPIKVQAATLADLAAALSKLPEAGRGGGKLRADAPQTDSTGAVSVKLQGNLVNQVVEWVGYDSASAAAKAHWDTVLKNLKRHEKRHMEIAIEVGNYLAKVLIGHEIGSKPSIADKTTAANTRMQKLQDDMDSANESDHGRKKGHAFGDCNIDVSIQ